VLKRAVLLQTHALMLKERAEVIEEELHVRTFCAAGGTWVVLARPVFFFVAFAAFLLLPHLEAVSTRLFGCF